MPITPISADMAIISALSDEPNDVTGLTSTELKAKFDEAGQALKTYINDTLLPNLSAGNVAFTPTAGVPEVTDAQSAIEAVQQQIADMALGQIPDGAITQAKLSGDVQQSISSKATVMHASGTLTAALWAGDAAPFTYELTVTGLLAADSPHVTRTLAHDSTDKAVIKAWSLITDAAAMAGKLKFYAGEKPAADIPVLIEVVR